jgi:hypothetical protein
MMIAVTKRVEILDTHLRGGQWKAEEESQFFLDSGDPALISAPFGRVMQRVADSNTPRLIRGII